MSDSALNYVTFFKRHGFCMPNRQFRQLCEVARFDPKIVKEEAANLNYRYYPEFKITLDEQIREFFPQI